MPLVTSRSELNQGSVLSVAGAIFAAGTGADIRLHTGAANNLPALAVNEFFEVRNHSLASNNGLYRVVAVTTSTDDYEVNKVSGVAPVVAGSEAVTTLGASGAANEKSVMFDTAALEAYIIEQGNVDAAGVTGAAKYSFLMQEWRVDDFLIANAPFPMNAIDNDAGKYIMGQDNLGNNNGWTWKDDAAFSIRTRKLLRNMGWDEVDAVGVILARFFNATTLGTFEDPVNDNAFYQFGTDTTVDDTVNFTFNGPVNEAVQFFERLADGSINGGTGVAVSADGRTLTRADGGNWRTDGFLVGGQITLRDSEDATMDGTWLLSAVGSGVDGVVTCGRAADANAGINFTDGGGGNDQLVLPSGETTFTEYGFVVGSKIIVTAAEDVGNDGTHVILAISSDGLTADVATASFTANADDTTAVIGMFDDALTPDTTINAAVNNDNAVRLGLRVRDGDPNGKTFGEANLASAGRDVLGNFVFAFPLANATDLKIIETDANIDANTPYTGMSITFHSTPQARGGLVGGPFNFGIIVEGNNGTNIEIFEFIQRQLRRLTDIDADADTAIGRTIGLLARFNGDEAQFGSGDGGPTFPVNPSGGGSGVFVDSVNAVDANAGIFFDNTGVARAKPEAIAVTLDFNQIAIDDTTTQFDLFFDRTIRTNVTDFVLTAAVAATGVLTLTVNAANNDTVTIDEKTYTFQTTLTDVDGNVLIGAAATDSIDNLIAAITLGAGAGTLYATSTTLHPRVTAAAGAGDTMDATAKTAGASGNSLETTETGLNMSWGGATLSSGLDAIITSAGTNLPNNAELAAGSYVRVSGLTAGDAAMNGAYFILTETTPGANWDVERYDGKATVAVASATVDVDQNVVDTPDAILVDTNNVLTATTISFTAPDTISDSANGLAVFAVGQKIRVEGSAGNSRIYEVATSSAASLTTVEQTIVTEGAGPSITITQVASGQADADFTFSFAFDDNVQGGRTVSTTTFVQGKAIGSSGAQYVQSAVSSIVTGTPLTIPLFAATERNFT